MLSVPVRKAGSRLLDVRRFVRLHPVRRRHRSVLGALARARVPESGAVAAARAGEGSRSGPDATGVGWIYEYALVDRTGNLELSQLRALQDWFLKYELKTVPTFRKWPSVGGMVRQYQIVLDPDRLRAYNISHARVIDAGAEGQPGNRRLGDRVGRSRVHGSCLRLSAVGRRHSQDPVAGD
jgi:hypothetical protein